MDRTEYCNDLMVRMEELFYHEMSDCAPWKTEMVGIDFIRSREITGDSPEKVIESCVKGIIGEGLVKGMSFSISGKGILLKLSIKDCIHIPKEIKIREHGIDPYNCPIANMIRDQLIEKLNFETTYLADMNIDEVAGKCELKVAIYETPDKIGEVSDWSKE